MTETSLTSTVATAASYTPETSILRIVYANGSICDYFDVPPLVWDELTTTASVGRYINYAIRGIYDFEYVERGSG